MAKKDKTFGAGHKKRKADTAGTTESSSKKVRREAPSPKVVLPHSPGGRLHGQQKRLEGEGDAEQQNVSVVSEGLRKYERRRGPRRAQREAAPQPPPSEPQKAAEPTTRSRRNRKPKTKTKQTRPDQGEENGVDGQAATQRFVDDQDAIRKQIRREEKKARRAAEREEHAEAMGGAELDQEVAELDNMTIVERADAEVDALGLVQAEADVRQPDWSLSSPSAGRFIDHDPIFTRDSATGEEVLITATRQEVQVLSIATSLVLRTCPVKEARSITCYALRQDRINLLDVACDRGRGFQWDWTLDAAEPVPYKTDRRVIALACSAVEGVGDVIVSISTSANESTVSAGTVSYKTTKPLRTVQSLGDAECIIASGPTALVLGMRKNGKDGSPTYVWTEISISVPVTCADARLTYNDRAGKKRRAILSLAVGNVEGQVHLYDDISTVFAQKGETSFPTPRILHWHREAVSAVKFSRDGNYLISGGKETVLVLWQLATGKKQFLPHLTSEIEHIVVSLEGDRYAVQMGDNSIMVLSTSELKPVANFAGLQLACSVKTGKGTTDTGDVAQKKAAAILHPQNQNQLLLSVPATQPKVAGEAAEARPFLQTFDMRTSRHMARQALTRNNATDFNLGPDKTPIASPDVAHLAVSHDGQWLATVDEWMPPPSDVEYLAGSAEDVEAERYRRREVYLKIWQWDGAQRLWTLSTRVDAPHMRSRGQKQGAGKVFSLLADPQTVGFATVGEDSRVKTWKPRARVQHGVVVKSQEGVELVEWVCKRTVELPSETERADSPMDLLEIDGPIHACLAYSEDGSVLAAAQSFVDAPERDLVHFIDAISGEVQATKSGLTAGSMSCMGFLDRYLIVVSYENVHVWDLVTDSLHQRYDILAGYEPQLAINHVDGTFAVATGSRVSVYKPTDKTAVYSTVSKARVEAILTRRRSKGYTLLLEDATVRTLSPSTAQPKLALPSAAPEMPVDTPDTQLAMRAPADDAEQVSDVEMSDRLALPPAEHGPRRLVFEDAEDDRRVVRPEQLANTFDVGQSFAVPPMHDMLEAVVALFGRARVAGVGA